MHVQLLDQDGQRIGLATLNRPDPHRLPDVILGDVDQGQVFLRKGSRYRQAAAVVVDAEIKLGQDAGIPEPEAADEPEDEPRTADPNESRRKRRGGRKAARK